MNEVIDQLIVKVERRNMFPKETPAQEMIAEEMFYGVMQNGKFLEGQISPDGWTIFHRKHPGRGIRIVHQKEDPIHYELRLSLPSTKEEIEDFFYCVVLLAKRQVCMVTLNEKPFTPRMYHGTCESAVQYNLTYLHHWMGEILNENLVRPLECVFDTFAIDIDTAQQFWAGINTDAYRDWLAHMQRKEPSSLSENSYD